MSNRINHFVLSALLLASLDYAASAQNNLAAKAGNPPPPSAVQPASSSAPADTDRVRDGLNGPVRRVRTEIAKLLNSGGKVAEDKRALLESASYDLKGNKTENQYFPVSGAALTGKEVYKYDEKGNISEMTLQNADGSLLSKEVYSYEFDFVGNWTKMTTSVAVISGGKLSFEPSEVSYRTITYYLDENMAKMVSAPPSSAAAPAKSASGSPAGANSTAKPGADKKDLSASMPAPATADKSSITMTSAGSAQLPGVPAPSSARHVVVMDGEPPARPKPILRPVSGGILNGSAVSLPSPVYPESARRMRLTGVVNVEVVIDETGKVISARAAGGNAMLAEAAVKAAFRARFSPTTLSGQPIKVTGTINYNFSLGQ